jgi:hypothetical protein
MAITFAFGRTGAREQPLAAGTQPSETLVNGVNAGVDFVGLRDVAPARCTTSGWRALLHRGCQRGRA